MKNTYDTLEFNIIKEKLTGYAHSDAVKDRLLQLTPSLDETECIKRNQETTSARRIIDSLGVPPFPYAGEINNYIEICDKGAMLTPEQLSDINQFFDSGKKLKRYLKKAYTIDEKLGAYGNSIVEFQELSEEITRCIRVDRVDDIASSTLKKIRNSIEKLESQVKTKAEAALKSNAKWCTENFVSYKSGHYVLPIKKQFRNQFNGSVIETSGSGGTYFMEPASVAKIQTELQDLKIQEDEEVRIILFTLSSEILDNAGEITINLDVSERLDFIFAKARYSQEIDGNPAEITTDRIVRIIKGRHPLLDKEVCVPLDFSMNKNTSGVIITGPNTGGKTVTLKTVGLLSVMAQCGLHIPADKETVICMHDNYLCDIGDNQSISESLSTFSAHMNNIIGILEEVTSDSLVLLDELGSGTDPSEGMGIAVAVLEELRNIGCMFLVTTHYPQVKDYALKSESIKSARMAFDKETLSPKYRLEMDEVGESCAIHIAEKLGLPSHILGHAKLIAESADSGKIGMENFDFSKPSGSGDQTRSKPKQKLIKKKEPQVESRIFEYNIGDNVKIQPGNITGIVYKPADEKGDVCVQVKGEKAMYNHKRLKLHIPAGELYPPDYDFSIIFDTVDNRKAKNKLDRGSSKRAVIKSD